MLRVRYHVGPEKLRDGSKQARAVNNDKPQLADPAAQPNCGADQELGPPDSGTKQCYTFDAIIHEPKEIMAYDLRKTDASSPHALEILSSASHISPTIPGKQIHNGEDLGFFLRSKAYTDIMTFVLQLNRSMVPEAKDASTTHTWPLDSKDITLSGNIKKIASIVQSLKLLMENAPPEKGPRRFGNAAFRTWYTSVQDCAVALLKENLPNTVWEHVSSEAERGILEKELEAYLLGSFGSPERLDYGTGHELSFLAFLGCIWKLGGFSQGPAPGSEERAIVVGIIQPYLELVRSLILTYTLEPAGSHGVWGLDDHSFLPYILGSAQYCPPTRPSATLPTEGSLQGAPSPDRIAKREFVEQYRHKNMYFSAIGFIFDVKTGPFWEHSPTLFDISGIKDGWAKINKGMMKMFNAEVLSKFPVVQHFPFGTLFSWEADPRAAAAATTPHMTAQPSRTDLPVGGNVHTPLQAPQPSTGARSAQQGATTAAPWAKSSGDASRTAMPVPQGGFGVVPGRMPLMNTTTTTAPPRYNPGAGRSQPGQIPSQFPGPNKE